MLPVLPRVPATDIAVVAKAVSISSPFIAAAPKLYTPLVTATPTCACQPSAPTAPVTAAIAASFSVYSSPKIPATIAVVATLTTAPTNISVPFSAKKAPAIARMAKLPSESINITGLFLQ